MPDTARLSGPCNRGAHDGCRSSRACGCDCHLDTPAARKLAGAPPLKAVPADATGVDGIEWGDPPPANRAGRISFEPEVLAALKARPGTWAKVHTYPSASGAYTVKRKLKAGDHRQLAAGEWEAESRNTGTKAKPSSALWLRYIGG